MACITSLEQNLDQSWSGRAIRSGDVRKFKTLDDYEQYTRSLQDQGRYCAEAEKHYMPQYKPGTNTVSTGFMEFAPRDPVAQAKYSAMSPTWQGIDSSEAAIARGDYDLDAAEKNREDLRAKKAPPKLEMPHVTETAWNCSIQ
jgi:hypothetical protein